MPYWGYAASTGHMWAHLVPVPPVRLACQPAHNMWMVETLVWLDLSFASLHFSPDVDVASHWPSMGKKVAVQMNDQCTQVYRATLKACCFIGHCLLHSLHKSVPDYRSMAHLHFQIASG